MTRIQRERFFNEEEYLRLKSYFVLTKDKLSTAKNDMIVMHPLPRVDEIHPNVDEDPRAVYFQQAQYGMYVRMALILKLLKGDAMLKVESIKEELLLTILVPALVTVYLLSSN